MSKILVPMEMPKNCNECRKVFQIKCTLFANTMERCLCNYKPTDSLSEYSKVFDVFEHGRLEGCPLIEVEDADRDELYPLNRKMYVEVAK